MPNGDWPPPDIRFVLASIESETLKEWVVEQGGERPRTQVEALIAAVRADQNAVRPLYLSSRIGGRAAATWFRNCRRPRDLGAAKLHRLSKYGDELGDQPYALVWVDEGNDRLSLRLAYLEGFQVGTDLEPVERLGFSTLIWHTIRIGHARHQVLEVHSKSPQIRKVVFPALHELGSNLDVEVLDFRSNPREEEIRRRLAARLTEAVADIKEPTSPDDQVKFKAKRGRDLAQRGSKFAEFRRYPGRGRTIQNDELTVTISQKDYSAVFPNARLELTALVFTEAVQVGEWTAYV